MTGKVVYINYVNWRGQTRGRRILPHNQIRYGTTEFHPEPCWLFLATDLTDGKLKEFAMEGVKCWEPAADQSLPWRS